MARSEYTSAAVASLAGRVLRGYVPNQRELMVLAASALTQAKARAPKRKAAKKASK